MTLLGKNTSRNLCFLGVGAGGNEWLRHGVLKTKLTQPTANGAVRGNSLEMWKRKQICVVLHINFIAYYFTIYFLQ